MSGSRAYEDGRAAALVGEAAAACRLRRADRRAAWIEGWRAGCDAVREADDRRAARAVPEADRARGRGHLAALREQLRGAGR